MKKNLTNKELRDLLLEFPDDMEVMINRNGSIYTICDKPTKKYLNPGQKEYIVLSSPIPL